jgi:hypothetical protein
LTLEVKHQPRRTIVCEACHSIVELKHHALAIYLSGEPLRCGVCGTDIDPWENILNGLKQFFPYLVLIGGNDTFAISTFRTGQPNHINFSDAGIPDDARIVSVNLTLETGEVPEPKRFIRLATIAENSFYPKPMPHSVSLIAIADPPSPEFEVKVNVAIWWVTDNGDSDEAERLLSDAFVAYYARDFKRAIIDAHTALDFRIEAVIGGSLLRASGLDDVRMAYPAKLATMAAMAERSKIAPLPQHIFQLATDLGKRRNDQAHPRRRRRPEPQRDEAAELLCAAAFTMNYLRYRITADPHRDR